MLQDIGKTILGASDELEKSVKPLDNDKIYKTLAITNKPLNSTRPMDHILVELRST